MFRSGRKSDSKETKFILLDKYIYKDFQFCQKDTTKIQAIEIACHFFYFEAKLGTQILKIIYPHQKI